MREQMMTKPGKFLEQAVADIERAMGAASNVTVESPKRLRDRITGQLREHDIILTVSYQHHAVTIALECRDHARPVTVNQIEGFAQKCADTGVNQGVIVSSSGFYATARHKAGHLGIRCLSLTELSSVDWLAAGVIEHTHRHLDRHDWRFVLETEGVVTPENMEVVDPSGSVLTREILFENALAQLNHHHPTDGQEAEHAELIVKFQGGGLVARNTATRETSLVKEVIATLKYSVIRSIIPLTAHQYSDDLTAEHITDAVSADIPIGGQMRKLLITYKKNEGGQVVLLPPPSDN